MVKAEGSNFPLGMLRKEHALENIWCKKSDPAAANGAATIAISNDECHVRSLHFVKTLTVGTWKAMKKQFSESS